MKCENTPHSPKMAPYRANSSNQVYFSISSVISPTCGGNEMYFSTSTIPLPITIAQTRRNVLIQQRVPGRLYFTAIRPYECPNCTFIQRKRYSIYLIQSRVDLPNLTVFGTHGCLLEQICDFYITKKKAVPQSFNDLGDSLFLIPTTYRRSALR